MKQNGLSRHIPPRGLPPRHKAAAPKSHPHLSRTDMSGGSFLFLVVMPEATSSFLLLRSQKQVRSRCVCVCVISRWIENTCPSCTGPSELRLSTLRPKFVPYDSSLAAAFFADSSHLFRWQFHGSGQKKDSHVAGQS